MRILDYSKRRNKNGSTTYSFGPKIAAAILALVVAILVAVNAPACSPAANRQVVSAVVDVALAACVLEHPDMSEQELYAICRWAPELAPIVKELIASQKKGLARMHPADAGANDGGK